MIATHFWIRLRRDTVIAGTPEARRLVARTFLQLDHSRRLLAFGLADTHAHGVRLGAPPAARDLARRIEHSLQRRLRLPVGFAPVDWEAVDTVWRLRNAFFYVLTQCRHHALDWDPILESTNVPDLLGMRILGAYARPLVRQHLPRVAASDLLRLLNVPALSPAHGPADHVVLATQRALALPALQGRGQEVRQGRRAALEVLTSQIPLVEAARVLGIARGTAYRVLSRPADPALVAAIRLQLGLMAQLEAGEAGA